MTRCWLTAVAFVLACSARKPPSEAGVELVFAEITEPAPEGPSRKVSPATELAGFEKEQTPGPVVRLAIAPETPWNLLGKVRDAMEKRDQKPIFLVGNKSEVRAIALPIAEPGDSVLLSIYLDGMVCATAPGVREEVCGQSADKTHQDKSAIRQVVYAVAKNSKLERVTVKLPETLPWRDVVAAVDGARSCCQTPVTVGLAP